MNDNYMKNYARTVSAWVLGIGLVLGLSGPVTAASAPARTAPTHMGARTVASRAQAADGIEFKTRADGGLYTIMMRPNATPDSPNLTLTSQVTLKVPHATGTDRFQVADLESLVAGTDWALTSRVDAPVEDPTSDYLAFELGFPDGNYAALVWRAGEAQAVFRFRNAGSYRGAVGLMEGCDAFAPPNSLHSNMGNQITVLSLGEENAYLGAYDGTGSECLARVVQKPDDKVQVFLPFLLRLVENP